MIQVSFVKPLGTTIEVHSITLSGGCAGIRNAGPLTITSGLICHPSAGHSIGAGASFGSPAGAPLSAHFTIVSMSACFRDRSLANLPYSGSANQGGICRDETLTFMLLAHGRASSYVRSDIGAMLPGRWQV